MVETKCIHVDRAQAASAQDIEAELTSDWSQALSALHHTISHEHPNFFLAHQHLFALSALRSSAANFQRICLLYTK